MAVNGRWSMEWACHLELVVFPYRFGHRTSTNPFTQQRSIATVGVWLGVQTGNKRTTTEWTRPGNRTTISFWLGEFYQRTGFCEKYGIELKKVCIHILIFFSRKNEGKKSFRAQKFNFPIFIFKQLIFLI
jgi:hypothetical protein